MFKLPQDTLLGKRNHDNRLNLSTRADISAVRSSINGNGKPREKPEKENSFISPTTRFILSKNHLVNGDRCSRCGNLKTA